MDLNLASLNPPIPNSSSSQMKMSEEGKQLLNLLKSLERMKKDESMEENGKPSSLSVENEILSTIDEMRNKYQHRGLFENDPSRAQQSSIPTTLASAKKRKRGGANSTGKIASLLNLDGSNSTSEAYEISNLCRILIPHPQHGIINPSAIIASAAIAIHDICEYCKGNLPNETAVLEQEMVSSIASQLLSGLGKTMRLLMDDDGNENEDNTNDTLIACCKCAMNVIILSNVKLSRSGTVMELVKNVAKDILFDDYRASSSYVVIDASADLIATIPLTGNGTNNKLPMQLWSETVVEYAAELSMTLKGFFPYLKKLKKGKNASEENVEWIEKVKDTIPSQAERLVIFFSRVRGIVAVLNSLLKMEGYCMSNSGNGALIPITSMLEVCEQMLLFASVAETRFLSTKSRLRDISVEGGLLGPKSALAVANGIKNLGHVLFDAVVSTLTTTSLQYGRQIIRIGLTSLQSSSSLALKTVIDPMSCADKNSKQKWLHSSVQLRTAAIKSFELIVQRLGSNASMTQNEAISKGIALISGCLLEQLSEDDLENNIGDEHWGTFDEKATLVATCADTLSSFLSVFGGFMALHNRELVESVASTCLYNMTNDGTVSRFTNYTPVKISFLRLGTNCITSPWPDGGASTIVGTVRRAAFSLKFSRDSSLSSTAYSALNICNMAQSTRSPPLVIVTRSTESTTKMSSTDQFFSRTSLEEGISVAKDQILTSKIVEKDVTEKKRKKQAVEMEAEAEKSSAAENTKSKDGEDKAQIFTENLDTTTILTKDDEEKGSACEKSGEVDGKPDTEEQDDSVVSLDEQQEVDPPSEPDESEAEEDVKMEEVPRRGDQSTYSHNDSYDDNDDDESDGDDDFPPIIDCGPDEEDM